ncbi:MAG: formylglycine-generating enzyme family protein, partial [Thermodesulfobacteriota bacterium]
MKKTTLLCLIILLFLPYKSFSWFENDFEPVWNDSGSEASPERFTNYLGMEFVYIKPGTFMMGSPISEPGRDSDEKQHKVTLTKGYYMQTTEVTQGQWKKVMGNNPSRFDECGDDCPVEYISWKEAKKFIKKLNKLDEYKKFTYRLPTEAEWEYAARAGTQTALYSGDTTIKGAPELDEIAWYGGNSCVDYSGGFDCSDWYEKQTGCASCGIQRTGLKKPNAWGLYDMIGNVWEWCEDRYGDYPTGQVTDPRGPGPD